MKQRNKTVDLLSIDHHRNGISGIPFTVATCIDYRTGKHMVVVQFDDLSGCYTAALEIEELAKDNVVFGSNSYRGDDFSTFMDSWKQILRDRRENRREANRKAESGAQAFVPGSVVPTKESDK